MLLGTVQQAIVAPTRHPGLAGAKLLHVEVVGPLGPWLLLAVDTVGAGVGDRVAVAVGGHAALAAGTKCPTDAVIVGIVEQRG